MLKEDWYSKIEHDGEKLKVRHLKHGEGTIKEYLGKDGNGGIEYIIADVTNKNGDTTISLHPLGQHKNSAIEALGEYKIKETVYIQSLIQNLKTE